jgi:hypothetical protein
MRIILFFILILFFGKNAIAQNQQNIYSLGVSTEMKSFSIPQNIEYFPKVKYQPGIAVNAAKFINTSFNLSGKAAAAIVQHPLGFQNNKKLIPIFEAMATAQYKLNNDYIFSKNAKIQPFITSGFGFNFINTFKPKSFIPFGFGANIPIKNDWALQFNSTYHFVTNKANFNYYNLALGCIWIIGKDKIKEKPKPKSDPSDPNNAIADSDNDGINDAKDYCPNEPGTKAMNGCPDTDNDGVSDILDECPLVKGYANLKGCIDSDGDGVSDMRDKCKDTFGSKAFDGCEFPDSDDDGIFDDKDKCPNLKGSIIMGGCPIPNR